LKNDASWKGGNADQIPQDASFRGQVDSKGVEGARIDYLRGKQKVRRQPSGWQLKRKEQKKPEEPPRSAPG